MEELRKAVKLLCKNHSVKLTELEDNEKLNYNYQLITTYDGKLDNLLKDEFRPTVITPGTIGAFLFGCSLGTHGDAVKNCSPLCYNNLNYSSLQECEYQIWLQKDNGKFSQLNSVTFGKGYIYVNENFDGFTKEDIETFKNKKLVIAEVLRSRYGKYYTIARFNELINLPLKFKTSSNNANSNNNKNDLINIPNYNTTTTQFLSFVLLLLLLILVLFMISRRR